MTGTLPAPPPPPPDSAGTRPVRHATSAGVVLASVVGVEIVSGSLQSFLTPLFHALSETLDVTAAQLNWVSIANLLSSAVFAPVLSRMGDLYGHRRILRWNLAIILFGSLLVALARDFEVLLVGQVLQGALSGLFPLLVGIVRNHGGEAENRRGIGLMVASIGVGSGLGLVGSGLVAEYADSPTSALWVPVAAVAVAIAIAQFALPETTERPGGRVDWAGGLLIAAGLVGVLLALSQGQTWGWISGRTLGYGLGGLVLLAAFTAVELRHPEPMVNVRMFARGRVLLISVIALLFSFVFFSLTVPGAIFSSLPNEVSGFGLGLGSLAISFAALPAVLGMAAGAMVGPALAQRGGDRTMLVTGALLMTTGYGLTAMAHNRLVPYLLFGALAGIGIGLLQQGTRTIAVEAVSADETAVGSGINELMITVGGSLGAATVGAIMTAHTEPGTLFPKEAGFTNSWWLAAGVSLLAALVACLYRPQPTAGPAAPATGGQPRPDPRPFPDTAATTAAAVVRTDSKGPLK
ncbi:MFS transporter [Streptomyces poriferorum]|uniref:MFS transporter n=1 Tax=Streptomyces poriferorum TaxID=2798799 RepID=A0ABY9IPS2_9ACTN|nr:MULTISPECIES: MFS transporter [unclassified Streptomyces]MDP5313768.1 MFS transporter [Streptomyces sp. Alt4]WLQ57276.1 MFS transporter [Streptomyces sp. Alt2]